jgi:phage-related minor tail protein
MADTKTRILITALDKTKPGFASVKNGLRSISSAAASLTGALAGIGGAISINQIVRATVEQERVTRQLEQTLKSTGGAAGLARDELLDMAAGLQKVTTFGDEATIAAQALLLTFTGIGRDVFPQALESVLNVSTAMGTDLRSAALQVGKALNDPVRGMSSLAESGIQFTDAQRDLVKSLVETGQRAKAQAIILAELETQFGGSARAARDTLGGALASLQNAFGDLLEGEAGGDGVRGATRSINDLTNLMESAEVKAAFGSLTEAVFKLLELTTRGAVAFRDFGQAIGEGLARSVYGSDNPVTRINDEIAELETRLEQLAGELQTPRAFRINPFESTQDLERDYDQVLTRLRNLRDVRDSLGNVSAEAALVTQPTPTTPASPTRPSPGAGASSASRQAADEQQKLFENIQKQIGALKQQAATFGLSERAATLYKLSMSGATEQQLASADAALAEIEVLKNRASIQERAKSIYEATRTPVELLNAEIEELNKLFNSGAIDVDTYGRAVAAAQDQFSELSKAGKDELRELQSAIEGWGKSSASALADFVMGGKSSFNDFARSVIRDLIEMSVYQNLVKPLFGMMGGAGGPLASLGSMLFGGFRAAGGPVASGTAYVVGERGPELFVPNTAGRIVPNGPGAGGDMNVSIVVNAEGGARQEQSNSSQAAELGRRIETVVRGVLVQERRPGGILAGA